MKTAVTTPQSRCIAGIARADITPPVGIYHRMWGAATHERAEGVHRPLTATALWLEARDRDPAKRHLVLALDHCILDSLAMNAVRTRAAAAVSLDVDQVRVCLSHTHGSGWMSPSRSHLPGGELIAPYLESVAGTCANLAIESQSQSQPATILYGTARCDLAAHRDAFDEPRQHFVCGFNPEGPADDTILLARVIADDGRTLGTIVNYACHPTTLAWENRLISPDFVGAMREVIEAETHVPCVFLQGASGDLGPREGFVGDPAIADRNGRQLGYAALSGLTALPTPGTRFEYSGPVVSGATLGTWEHRMLSRSELERQASWDMVRLVVELPYRADLPTMEETRRQRSHWEKEEAAAQAANDADRARDFRAQVEQMTRQETRLLALPAGKSYPFTVTLLRLGEAVGIFTPGELYQSFQTSLRSRFPHLALVIAPLTDDWQPGYVPAKEAYGHGIYQDIIAAVASGSLEYLIEEVGRAIEAFPPQAAPRE